MAKSDNLVWLPCLRGNLDWDVGVLGLTKAGAVLGQWPRRHDQDNLRCGGGHLLPFQYCRAPSPAVSYAGGFLPSRIR